MAARTCSPAVADPADPAADAAEADEVRGMRTRLAQQFGLTYLFIPV